MRNVIFNLLVGMYLMVLSIVMLWMVIRAIPNGTLVMVNAVAGVYETVGDIVALVAGMLLGVLVIIRALRKALRNKESHAMLRSFEEQVEKTGEI